MAKPNYSFEKRQRDLAKRKKKEEKLLKRAAGKDAKSQVESVAETAPAAPGEPDTAGSGAGAGGN